jgi:hypothetical protein
MIELENGALVVRNVPVARRAYDFPWLSSTIQNLRRNLSSLRTVELVARISENTGSGQAGTTQPSTERNAKIRGVLRKMLEDLKHLNEGRSSKLVLVYLPTLRELKGSEPRGWTVHGTGLEALGIPFITDSARFERCPYEHGGPVHGGQLDYPDTGHLNEKGNEMMASNLRRSQTPSRFRQTSE